MLTGDIRNQVDQIWNSFWTGGIANPLEVMDRSPVCCSFAAWICGIGLLKPVPS